MLKQFVLLMILSACIILSATQAQQGVQWLLTAHDWITQLLADVFSEGQAGNIAKGLIALLSIPFLVSLVPTVAFWVIRRRWFPYFMQIVWVIWLLQAGALLIAYKS